MKMALLISTVFVVWPFLLVARGGIEVTKQQYGGDWPFPDADKGVIHCEVRSFGGVPRPLVLIDLNDPTHGLNGTAFGVGGYPDARTKMRRHPKWGTYELGASVEFLKMGLRLCP